MPDEGRGGVMMTRVREGKLLRMSGILMRVSGVEVTALGAESNNVPCLK
jgi:hypothetical protein